MHGYVLRVVLMAAAVLLTCCNHRGLGAGPVVVIPDADKDPHKAELQQLLQTIADGIKSIELPRDEDGARRSRPDTESFNRWHAARKRLPEILRPDDVPAMKELMLKNTYEGMGRPPKPLDREKQNRISFATDCMGILRDYYIRTNDPLVTAFFVELLHGGNRGYLVGSLLTETEVVRFSGTLKNVLWPGLERTAWPEALHREYLKLKTVEAQMMACKLLYAGEKYADEATWFLCRVLNEPDKVLSDDELKKVNDQRREAGYPAVTAREGAVIDTLEYLGVRAANAQDRELRVRYEIPWCRYFVENGTPELKKHAGGCLTPETWRGWDIDLDRIPAGTPVPPKPKTVIEEKQEADKKKE